MRHLPHRPFPLRAILGILGASPHEHDPPPAIHDDAASALASSVIGSVLQDTTKRYSQYRTSNHCHEPMAVRQARAHWLLLQVVPEDQSFFSSLLWTGVCQCLAAKLSEGYPEEIDCRLGLAEIRTRWGKEHKDLDRFGPPEHNTLRPV